MMAVEVTQALIGLAGGTRFTLAWSEAEVELWRGGRAPHEVLSVPWQAVASVTEGSGYAASSARPAVVVSTVAHATLVLVPCARPSGGVLHRRCGPGRRAGRGHALRARRALSMQITRTRPTTC
jgi:hypothetical protein